MDSKSASDILKPYIPDGCVTIPNTLKKIERLNYDAVKSASTEEAVKDLFEKKNKLLIEVAKQVLGKEPSLEDAKSFTIVSRAGFENEVLMYLHVVIGQIIYDNMEIHFIPVKDFS